MHQIWNVDWTNLRFQTLSASSNTCTEKNPEESLTLHPAENTKQNACIVHIGTSTCSIGVVITRWLFQYVQLPSELREIGRCELWRSHKWVYDLQLKKRYQHSFPLEMVNESRWTLTSSNRWGTYEVVNWGHAAHKDLILLAASRGISCAQVVPVLPCWIRFLIDLLVQWMVSDVTAQVEVSFKGRARVSYVIQVLLATCSPFALVHHLSPGPHI